MSWLFSQALVEEYSEGISSDGEQSVQSNGNPTQLAYLPPDRMTAFSRLSRYGMTFRPLTADRGEELLMSYLAAFRAKTSALPERARASQESAAECGDTWRGSLARFDPDTSLWKTVQHSLLEDSESCSVIWPRSGMTADGQCWELPTLERRTSATGSGLWPTPVASDIGSRSKPYAQGGTPLSLAVKWPTPTVCGNYNRKGASATSGDGLATAVNRWPTPIARDSRSVRGGARTVNSLGSEPLITQVAIAEGVTDGALNPMWVEWLMGWPLGWTDLKPLEMDKCQPAPQQHGDC